MRLAAAKIKKAVLQPEFVTGIRANGTTTQIYPEECQLYLFRRGTDGKARCNPPSAYNIVLYAAAMPQPPLKKSFVTVKQ